MLNANKFAGYDENATPEENLLQFYLSGSDNEYGYVGDLPNDIYFYHQKYYISLGRGSNPAYGNIDDLCPNKHRYKLMSIISRCRGMMTSMDA